MSKRISAEDSRHEDIEVAHLTKELSKELIANKLDEMVKSRHPSSQSTQSRNISRHSSFLDAPCAGIVVCSLIYYGKMCNFFLN